MPRISLPGSVFFRIKIALFALLAANAGIFVLTGTLSEALDALAWLVLLALFELETSFGDRFRRNPARRIVRGIRFAAAVSIGAAAVGYVYERAWLEALNAWLWIAVVVLLEYEVRRPLAVALHRNAFTIAAVALYTGLAAVIPVWAWRGEWLDAYDALLWLIAFAALEINVLQVSGSADEANAAGRHG